MTINPQSLVQTTSSSTSRFAPKPVNLSGLDATFVTQATPQAAVARALGWIIVTDPAYGAVGNGTTDDTAAIQAAFNAAILTKKPILFPVPTAHYSVRSTIVLRPASGNQFYLDIHGGGNVDLVQWDGGSNNVVFDVKGWKRSNVYGMKVRVKGGLDNVVVWDLDGDSTYTSLSQITWNGCHVTGTTSTNVVAYRIGHSDPTDFVDFSYLTFTNCHVGHNSPAPVGTIAYLNEGPNSLNHIWLGGGIYNCATAVSNAVTAGAHAAANTPGSTLFMFGLGTSGTSVDFDFRTRGTYTIYGGRFEVGKRFLNVGNGGQSGPEVIVSGVELISYAPTDGILFNLSGGVGLTLDAPTIRPATAAADYTAAMITMNGGSLQRGWLNVRGGRIRASDPFYTVGSGNWSMGIEGVRHFTSGLSTDTLFKHSYLHGEDSAYASSLVCGPSSISTVYTSYQAERAIVGFDAAAGGRAVLDGRATRPASLRSNSLIPVEALPNGQANIPLGVRLGWKSPGSYPYTVLVTDHVISVSTGSAHTVLLPPVATSGLGHSLVIKDSTGGANTNNITVTASGTELIDGAASKVVNTAYGVLRVICNGTGWDVI